MNEIALRARESAREPQVTGVVVTHGTSTLEFTAYFTDLIVDSDCPVIFTGAMRNADREDADGPRNLRDAIAIATADETRSFGAIVCFSGRVFGARDVRKNEREATDAFTGGQIGAVDDHGVVLWDRPVRPRLLSGRVEPRVALVKAYPGCNHNGVDAVVDAGALGVVLEGLAGSGGIPSKMQAGIRRAVKSGLPVVLSSRAPHGRIASPPTGGTGAPLRDLDLISAGDLAAEKAWVLLCAALGEGHDIEAVGQIFREVAEPDQAPSRPDTEDSSPKTRRAR